MSGAQAIARIAIIAFETPEILGELQRVNAHGVISKPIRIFGIFSAHKRDRTRQQRKSPQAAHQTLDDSLRSRRTIEKAVAILCETRDISDEEAYRRLRDKAQNSNRTIGVVTLSLA